MKGHVVTPSLVVDHMVDKLLTGVDIHSSDTILDPGCGEGAFIDGIIRYCNQREVALPKIIGIELNPEHLNKAKERLASHPEIKLVEQDFLAMGDIRPDFIIGNPPYVPITGLDEIEKERYIRKFNTAKERFDLYMLFFEQSLRILKPGGRLCFITPEKFEFVHTASELRRLLSGVTLVEIEHIGEETFKDLVTYPTITLLVNTPPPKNHRTTIILRDGTNRKAKLPADGSSWNQMIHVKKPLVESNINLGDVTVRVSCGVATGADEIFIQNDAEIPKGLISFGYPTISGRQLGLLKDDTVSTTDSMLIPYYRSGKLMPEDQLKDFLVYLKRPDIERHLKGRTCSSNENRSWYQFHDNVPFHDMLKPKILCKDITQKPYFWIDREGRIVPRHTVYYIVPKESQLLEPLCEYLNSEESKNWLESNCQRAAGGFLRIQSAVLRKLPIPEHIVKKGLGRGLKSQTTLTIS